MVYEELICNETENKSTIAYLKFPKYPKFIIREMIKEWNDLFTSANAYISWAMPRWSECFSLSGPNKELDSEEYWNYIKGKITDAIDLTNKRNKTWLIKLLLDENMDIKGITTFDKRIIDVEFKDVNFNIRGIGF